MVNITSPTIAALALVVGSPLQGIPHDGTALGRCDELAGIVLSTSREPGVSCEYMYVYVHVYVHVRICTCVCTCKYMYMYVYVHVYM